MNFYSQDQVNTNVEVWCSRQLEPSQKLTPASVMLVMMEQDMQVLLVSLIVLGRQSSSVAQRNKLHQAFGIKL